MKTSGRLFRLLFILILLVLVGLLSGCSSESMDRLWMKSEGWSRGILLGNTNMAAPAPTALGADGKVFTMLFPRSVEDENYYQPELVILNQDGEISSRYSFDFQISQPRQSAIFLSGDGIDLFWIGSYQMKAAQINLSGELMSDIMILSGDERVANFAISPWNGGYELWYASRKDSPGVYALSGNMGEFQRQIVDPLGSKVSLYLDNENSLHASWIQYPSGYGKAGFYYLKITSNGSKSETPELIYLKNVSPAVMIDAPVISLDQDEILFLWSQQILTGLESGNRSTYLQHFPLDNPDHISDPVKVYIPSSQGLPAVPFPSGAFQAGDRINVSGNSYPSLSSLENIQFLAGQFSETVVVFRARSEFKWRDFRNQINIAYLSDSEVTSYQPLSYTSAESYYPSVLSDAGKNLYVTWLEKGQATYRVYLTTTDPVKRTYLDQVSLDDYLYLGAEGIFGLLAGVVLAPFAAAVWGGAGLLAFLFNIILSKFRKPIYRKVGETLSIAGGIFIFWWIKLATLPGLADGYVPFSAWIPRMRVSFEQPLIIGVPIFIGLAAFVTAWLNTYGKKASSAINFHLIYCAVDTVLSCAVYGILVYGSF